MGAALGAVGSIWSGLIGASASKNAGETIAKADTAASTAAGTAGNQAAAATNLATNTGVSGINAATNTGTQGILNAGTTAASGVNAAANQGNTVAGNLLGGQLQNLSPYLSTGATGSNALNTLTQQGFSAPTAAQAAATPGEQFQMQQGLQGVEQTLNAQGGGATGGAEKALEQYGQGVASTYYQNAFNNALQGYQTNVNTAATGASQGLQSSQLANQAAQNYGNIYNSNTVGAAQYGGNAGITTNTSAGQLGLQGATAAGQLGVQGAETAGNQNFQGTLAANNYFVNGAQATAAGILGQTQGYQNAINGATGAAQGASYNYFSPTSSSQGNLGGSIFGSPTYSFGSGGIGGGTAAASDGWV